MSGMSRASSKVLPQMVTAQKPAPGPETLDRSENELTSVAQIKDAIRDNLLEINLGLNRIAVITSGVFPKTLRVLDMSSNLLKDCRSFTGLPNLNSLDLSLNQITSIVGIDLPALRTLSLQSNKLASLKGVERLRALETLNVDRNELKSLTFGGTNAALQEVSAQENLIQEVKATDLSSLLALSRLNLAKNQLKSLVFLEGIPWLEDLDVSRNLIEKLQLAKSVVLEDLYSLNLSHNGLERLGSIPTHFPSLTVVDISHNEIMDEDELDFMLHIDTLAEVSVAGNDCFSSEEEVHARFSFLEVVNRKRFRPTADRERLLMKEIVQDIRDRGLMTTTEIKQMQSELLESSKYEHKGLEKVFKNPDGEELAEGMIATYLDEEEEVQAPSFNITFKTNAKELEEFAHHFEDDFDTTYDKIRRDNNQATDTILQTKMSIQEQYKLLGLDGPFDATDSVKTKCVKLSEKDWKAESRRLSSASSSQMDVSASLEAATEHGNLSASMFKYSRLPMSRQPSSKEGSFTLQTSKMVKILPSSVTANLKSKETPQPTGTPSTGVTKDDTDHLMRSPDEEFSASDLKPASASQSSEGKSIFETKVSLGAQSKQNSFRLRTKSRDHGGVAAKRADGVPVGPTGSAASTMGITLGSRGSGDTSVLTQKPAPVQTQQRSHKLKMAINWAQKDLKKQNEEILKMIEGSGREVLSLAPRAPNKLSSIHSASKAGPP